MSRWLKFMLIFGSSLTFKITRTQATVMFLLAVKSGEKCIILYFASFTF